MPSGWGCLRWAATAATLLLSATARPVAAVEEIVVVFKTHFDIGYTDLARNVVDRYRTSMIDKALAVCDSAGDAARAALRLDAPRLADAARSSGRASRPSGASGSCRPSREGRLVWHALPASLHTESLDLEDLVRGMVFSSRLSREFGMPLPRDAKMTDVPSHTWILPTILKHAGVDFLHVGCNAGQRVARPAAVVLVGRTRRLAAADDVLGALRHRLDAAGRLAVQDLAGADPHRRQPRPAHAGGSQAAAGRRRRSKLPGVKLRMGRLSDFGDAVLAENPALPVVRADPGRLDSGHHADAHRNEARPAIPARGSPRWRRWARFLRALGRRRAAPAGRPLRRPTRRACSTASTPGDWTPKAARASMATPGKRRWPRGFTPA